MPEPQASANSAIRLSPGPPLEQQAYLRAARELSAHPAERPLRVAILASHTMTVMRPHLLVECARHGIPAALHFEAFGQFEQPVLDASSELWRFDPEAIVLALRLEDVEPDAVLRPLAGGAQPLVEAANRAVARLRALLHAIRERSQAAVLVANFAHPQRSPIGILDASLPQSTSGAVARANLALREVTAAFPGVALWDYAGLVADCGTRSWTDERLWYLGRIAISGANQGPAATHLARSIRAQVRTPAKCLVMDLDNTLWGGVLGDDGIEGIQIGDEFPGNAFKALQRHALALRDRGILLAVSSKNDHALVERAFREHPEMLLRWEHLASVRANWNPKSGNLREIADELNIGLDALVFLDDNPVERAEVSAAAPAVNVIDVPPGGSLLRALLDAPYFDAAALSGEDTQRAEQYRSERERRDLAASAGSVDDFLNELGMEANVGPVTDTDATRVVQLLGKTNQFNLTTRRHNAADVAAWRADPNAFVAQLRLRDRFGDQGLVVVAILLKRDADAIIDTFLMSCRVMNRRVEHAMMAVLAEQARRWGCRRLVGEYVPTPRNGMVEGFYPEHGFTPVQLANGEGTRYALELSESGLAWPACVRRVQDG